MAACWSWSEASLQAWVCETEREIREWAGKGQREREREKSEERDWGKCASIIWRARRISRCGWGAGHYVCSHLENMELNTGRLEWNCIRCCSAQQQKTEAENIQRNREKIPRAADVRSPKRGERLVGLVMKRAATVSTRSCVLRGKVGPMLPEFRAKTSEFSVYSSLTLILFSESAITQDPDSEL